MFIFDEIDQMPSQLLDALTYYLDFHTPSSSQPIDFRKTIFIFLRYQQNSNPRCSSYELSSNTGGKSINELTVKNHQMSIKRENFDILQFQQLLSNASFHEHGRMTLPRIDFIILLFIEVDFNMLH